jgi:hypothetical protein
MGRPRKAPEDPKWNALDRIRAEQKASQLPDATAQPELTDIAPNGMYMGVVQLPRDLSPRISTQRIVQWVNRNGQLKAYITESAYHRTECKMWFDKLFRESWSQSLTRGAASLLPVKSKIHWVRFEPSFLKGENQSPERIDPMTDEVEVEQR